MENELEHPLERRHWLGNLFFVPCTGCSHASNYHHIVGWGVWKCDYCGRKCYVK